MTRLEFSQLNMNVGILLSQSFLLVVVTLNIHFLAFVTQPSYGTLCFGHVVKSNALVHDHFFSP